MASGFLQTSRFHSLRLCGLFVVLVLTSVSTLQAAETQSAVDPLDWWHWRGPEQNGISRETGLVDRWSPDGENLLWARDDVGSVSTPIVMRGRLYMLCRNEPGTTREGEKVICLDAATGETIWENKFNVFLSDVPDTRVAWSSVVGDMETGRIYAQGVCGYFLCIDGETGKTIWSRSLSEEFGLLSTYGGRTNFPALFDDLVIISAVMTGWGDAAIPAHRFLAFKKDTGELVWVNATRPRPEDTTYSTPVTTVLNGQAAIVFGAGDGSVYAYQPRTGKMIWRYDFSRRGINSTPIIDGDTVYIGQSEENIDGNTMGAVVAIDGRGSGDITNTATLWKILERGVGKSAPVLVDGRLYAADDAGGLSVMNASNGEDIGRKQKLGSIMRSSLLWADGKIYACETNGRWFVFRTSDKGLEPVHRLRLPDGEECQASPIVSHGRIYLNTTGHLYCIGQKDHKPAATARPTPPVETPASADSQMAQLLIVPAEALLAPGDKQAFKVRAYNSRGQFLQEVTGATFRVESGGEVDEKGVFTAQSEPAHIGTTVTASVGDLQATARVRVVPPLPWKFDISDGQVPITWIGARGRHVARDVDGNKMLVKVTTVPKGTRSQAWMGPTDLHDYTIQADFQGQTADGKLPDMGLIAQRYTLDLMGAHQQLQIRTWTAVLEARMGKTVPFPWQAGVWYTMKFRASVEDGKAVLRGKVWKRDEAEPEGWIVEATDEVPNTTGSPGLFGNATNAEIFIDNIAVTSN